MFSSFLHPQDYPGVLEALRESAGTGRTLEHSHRVRVADGARWAWWRVYAVQIDYDAPHPVLLITAVYAVTAFFHLGSLQAPQSAWDFGDGEAAVFSLPKSK